LIISHDFKVETDFGSADSLMSRILEGGNWKSCLLEDLEDTIVGELLYSDQPLS